jgi:hypothetical protein
MEAAAKVLERQEQLIWHSVDRNESLPQTRLHYERILYGLSDGASASGVGSAGSAGSGKSKASGAPSAIVWPLHYSMDAGDEARVRVGMEFGPRRWIRADAVSGSGSGSGSAGGNAGNSELAEDGGGRATSGGRTPSRKKSANAKRRVDGMPERRSPRVASGVRKRKGGGGA